MALSVEERSWIWKLSKDQCFEVMNELKIEHGGEKNVIVLRGMLAKQVPEKNLLPEFQGIIKKWGTEITLQYDKLTLKRWALSLDEYECIKYLENEKLITTGDLVQLHKRFSRFLTELPGEKMSFYLGLAKCYVESLVHQSLLETNNKFDFEREELSIALQQPTNPEVNVMANTSGEDLRQAEAGIELEHGQPEEIANEILIPNPVNIINEGNRTQRHVDFANHPPLASSSPHHFREFSRSTLPSKGELMDKVRKWKIKFNGTGKPQEALIFIETIEETAKTYAIPLDLLPELISECLADKASEWFRNNKEEWSSWTQFVESFKIFFIPNRMRTQLENEVHKFYQGNKTIRDYTLSMQSLMRFIPDFDKKRQLDWIYQNLNPEYKTYIKLKDFSNLVQLIELGEEHERNQAEIKRISNRFQRKTFVVENDCEVELPYDRRTHCWNCGRHGHKMMNCQEPKLVVCSYCRRQNVTIKDCNCNGARKHRAYNKNSHQCNRKKPNQTSSIESCCANCGTKTHQSNEVVVKEAEENDTAMIYLEEAACVKQDPRPHISISIRGRTFSALLDTGATSSYVNTNTALFLESLGLIPRHTSAKTTLANGSSSNVSTVYWIELECGKQNISHDFMRLDGMTCEVLFGIDILDQLGYSLKSSLIPVKEHCYLVDRTLLLPEQEKELYILIELEFKRFADLPLTSSIGKHVIKMKTEEPFRQRYYPRNPCMKAIINEQIDELLASDQIEKSDSPFSSPLVLVRKKNGSWRMCVDFRQLNERSEQDAYPMPHIQPILNRLRSAKYISTIDLRNGYWQIPIKEDCRKFTAFTVPGRGLFQWKVMPFGLHSAPATFQRILDEVISHELEEYAIAYLDDIVVYSENFQEHLCHLKKVFERLYKAQLRINTEKSKFCKSELQYLGHVIGNGGIKTDPEKTRAILEFPTPSSIKEVRRLVAMASWYRNFIPNFSEIVAPLTQLTQGGKNNKSFRWTDDQQKAFDSLKQKMSNTPVLICPDFEKPFVLQTDASDIGLGAVLFQREDQSEMVISFSSRKLTVREQKYSTTEKECLAIVWAIQKNQHYLEGYEFTVITDHLSLKWLFKLENPKGRLARWIMQLQQYKFSVEYRKGKHNVVPDSLSRGPVESKNDPELEFAALADSNKPVVCQWYQQKIKEVTRTPEKYPDFSIVNGHLFKHSPNSDLTEDSWKLCLSKPQRERALLENHSTPTTGHLGLRKTISRISRNYYWPGMCRDIRKFVGRCKICLEYKIPQCKPAGYMYTLQPEQPWEIVCVDFVGPLPKSTKSCRYILIAQDKLTKWIELKSLSTPTTNSVKNMLRNQILSKFGWPRIIISDNGSQFTSSGFKSFLIENSICHQYTPKYSPQCNPVERTNRVIKTMIASFTRNKSHKKWDEFIPEIQFAYNTSSHESTGFTPAQLNFGRELKQPKTILDETGVKLSNNESDQDKSMRITEMIEIAKINLKKISETQTKYYNLRRRSWEPEIGNEVYVKDHHLSSAPDSFTAKLASKFSGPYIIVDFKSPNVVIVVEKSNSKRKPMTVHIKDLKQIPV